MLLSVGCCLNVLYLLVCCFSFCVCVVIVIYLVYYGCCVFVGLYVICVYFASYYGCLIVALVVDNVNWSLVLCVFVDGWFRLLLIVVLLACLIVLCLKFLGLCLVLVVI